MLYPIVRPVTTLAFKVYFRKIFLSNAQRIPRNKPVILVSNHPTAFMEPCIMACFLDRPLYFLVRGDFFAKPVYERLLRSLHMLPVFRFQDGGYKKLKDNFSTFQACYQALYDNKTIMIFAEGRTFYAKRLGSIQKGTARIAFGAIEAFPDIEDVYLVPVGVTYEEAHRVRSRVMIDCGEPISTRQFLSSYQENNVEGINALTDELSRRLRSLLVHIEDAADDDLVERLLVMDRSEYKVVSPPLVASDREPLSREMAIADRVNSIPEAEKKALKERVDDYFRELKQAGVTDAAVKANRGNNIFGAIFRIAGALPYLAGLLLNVLPFKAARTLVDKKVHHIEFYSPVMLASGMGFYLVYFILFLILGAAIAGWKGLLAVAVVVPTLGIFALRYGDFLSVWRQRTSFSRLPEEQRKALGRKRKEALASGILMQ